MGTDLMPAEENKVYSLLGMLQNQVSNLADAMDEHRNQTIAEHRTVHDIVVATSESVRNVARDVAEMKPHVEAYKLKAGKIDEAVELAEDYQEKRAEARGAAKFATALWVAVGGVIMFVVTKLSDLFTGRPPHPIVIALMLILSTQALAHDSWISRGGFRNWAGEWCCGDNDCVQLNYTPVPTAAGYLLRDGELVPFAEAPPSPDGSFWRCHRPDGSRRCFFAPRPNS